VLKRLYFPEVVEEGRWDGKYVDETV